MIFVVLALGAAVLGLGALMVGVLRIQAETLRRLAIVDRLEGRQGVELPQRESTDLVAHDVSGQSPLGAVVGVSVASSPSPHLLAFMSSGCTTCQNFWDALRVGKKLPDDVELLIITKGRDEESPSRILEIAPTDVPLVMSSVAWGDYSVPASPYFIYIDSRGVIRGEGTAQSWDGVLSLFKDALLDQRLSERWDFANLSTSAVRRSGRDDVAADDAVLQRAGIGPGHPSLAAGTHGSEPRDAEL